MVNKLSNEECDDGNQNSLDGWDSKWKVENGFIWIGGNLLHKDICKENCGDGKVIVDTSTNWDDGNLIDGDGWSRSWLVERGYTWSGGSPISPDICRTQWGDGVLVSSIEEWDDGNIISADGWNFNCKIESGFQWIINYSAPINSIWSEIWGDGKNMGISPWDDGNTSNGDGWSSSWTIESGFTWSGGTTTKKDTWVEICGDGKDYGVNECDDGNIINGDGWSSSCEFEKWYEWIDGSPQSIDKWSLLYITPNVTKISSSNVIIISFSHEMNQTTISLNDLLLEISSSYTIEFSWSATYSNLTTLNIAINTNTVLQGGEKVIITFVNYKTFRAPRGGCLTVYQLKSTLYGNLITSTNAANSLSWFAQYTAYFGIVVTVILVIVGGGSLEMVWSLLNSMQIVSYLPLLTEYFPNHVRIMFAILKFANMKFEFLSQIFKKIINLSVYSSVQYSKLFSDNGIDSSLILDNCASILFTIILYILLFLFSLFLYKLACWKILKRIGSFIVSLFLFNFVLRFMIEGYLELWFGVTLNLFAFNTNSGIELISLFLSWLLGIIIYLFPFMSFALIYDKRKEITWENESYLKRFGTMYENLKNDRGWEYLEFYPAFLFRRLIFVILLILLEGYSEIQWNIFITSSLMVSIRKIKYNFRCLSMLSIYSHSKTW